MLSENEALALLNSGRSISYEDLEDIFMAFGFVSEFEVPITTWYRHPRYGRCGEFRAKPLHDFSILSDEQKRIVKRMVECVLLFRGLDQER